MSQITVPGDELEEASQALARMLTFVESGRDSDRFGGDITEMFGPGRVADAARGFDRRWDDGRFQLTRQTKDIRDSIDQILEGFARVDQDSASALDAQ
ncbi:hypothetical protein [Micromonospora sp. NBC_01813]|jgi:hypothetical protein|uniref:hypothetical protein n=1 Tax=Micromonospora sp. NBC_01813 TaxID=2975988 RepID=UPI002DDA0CE4|nr:hypothetical protein [Micromonospora sp. NBC_01813]WSA07521.1 hypothetical protein OG958_25220 [Micromonospora sp. NBC_01813]